MKRILAIDYGTKRIGLALSDPLGLTAQPLPFVKFSNLSALIQDLKKIVQEKSVQLIIVGLPKNMDDSLGPKAQECMQAAQTIEKELGIEVQMLDERLTSRQAENILVNEFDMSRQRRKELVDSMSAAILLQSYLDAQSRSG